VASSFTSESKTQIPNFRGTYFQLSIAALVPMIFSSQWRIGRKPLQSARPWAFSHGLASRVCSVVLL